MSNDNNFSEEMRMEDFESMLEESLKQPTRGSTVKGTVAQIQGNQVIVNIGTKTEGVVDKSELADDVAVGDEVELIVVGQNIGDYMQLSRRMIDERSEWDALKDSVGAVVKVKVESHVEKGYRGKVGEVDAFIPENHIDLKSRMQAPESYVGKVLEAKVLKSGGGRHKSLLVSPKEFILEQSSREKSEFFERVKEGDILKGVIKTLKDYGAFVSLGAVDGFLHKSNLTWGRPRNPSKYVKEGEEVEVKILEVNPETGKVEVGLKQLGEDPWDSVRERFPAEAPLKASVVGRRRSGYIAEIEAGVDAFIPLEELSWFKNVRTGLNPKDVVEGRVIEYDDEHKRIVISVKMMSDNPWKTIKSDAPEGSVVEGVIKNVTDFGLFVDFGYFIDGLIRKGDISWTNEPENLEELFHAGDKVTAKVLKIDEDKERISLGIKQLSANPWKDMTRYNSGKSQEVTIKAITKNGLEVELANGIKAEIPSNELDPSNPSLEGFNVGDVISAAIVKADSRDRVVVLSIKKLLADSERKEAKEYMKKLENSDEGQGFGAIFKDKLK